MGQPAKQGMKMAAPLLLRAAAYFVFWVILAGTAPKDLVVGLVTAVIAAWMSLQLIPAGEMRLRPGKALALFCLLYTSPSPRDRQKSRMPSSA